MPRAPRHCGWATGGTVCTVVIYPPATRCPEHTVSGWKSSPPTPANRARTSTTAWRRLRLKVLARDGHQCQIRGPRCIVNATQVDHVVANIWGDRMFRRTCRLRVCRAMHIGLRFRHVRRADETAVQWIS
jgi:5-methylcytosine-specific restriction protein A